MTDVLTELRRLRDMLRNNHLTEGWTFVEGCVKCESIKSLEALIEQQSTPPEALTSWQPIDTAKKDGTLVLLLIDADDARDHPLEDTAEGSRTIGQNNFENDGEDKWYFAGWCWSHDHYTQGLGEPTHWMPLPSTPSPLASSTEK